MPLAFFDTGLRRLISAPVFPIALASNIPNARLVPEHVLLGINEGKKGPDQPRRHISTSKNMEITLNRPIFLYAPKFGIPIKPRLTDKSGTL